MTRSKKIFVFFAVLFLAAMVYVVIDFSSRTTFPGQKSNASDSLTSPANSDSLP